MSKDGSSKTVLFVSDLHCGARTGLSPEPQNEIQEELLSAWMDMVKAFAKPDILVVDGDAIDGKGHKDSGLDTLLNDPLKQVSAAHTLLEMIQAHETFIIAGTGYHVSGETDFESVLAERMNSELHSKLSLSVNAFVFDIRHFVGSSVIPHGRFTAGGRELMWETMLSSIKSRRRADMIVRGHVHYFLCGQTSYGGFMTLPCWQAAGSRYGARKCSGLIDIGAVRFTISQGGDSSWERLLFPIAAGHAKLVER